MVRKYFYQVANLFFACLLYTSNLAKAESLLETYTRIGCFLDNDTAGRNTCTKLKEKFGAVSYTHLVFSGIEIHFRSVNKRDNREAFICIIDM